MLFFVFNVIIFVVLAMIGRFYFETDEHSCERCKRVVVAFPFSFSFSIFGIDSYSCECGLMQLPQLQSAKLCY